MIEETPFQIERGSALSGLFHLGAFRSRGRDKPPLPGLLPFYAKENNRSRRESQSPVLIASIERRIYLIRGQKVMLDADLADSTKSPLPA